MKRYYLITGFIFAIIVIAFMLKDFVRAELVIPFLQIVRLVNDLSQAFIWFLFIAIVFIVAYASLNKWTLLSFKFRKKEKTGPLGHIEKLTRMVKKANKGGFPRYQLLQYLGELCVETFACKEKATPEEIRKRLASNTLEAPPDIIACLQALVLNNSNKYNKIRDTRSLRGNCLESQKVEPSHIVRFIEQQLEVFNGAKDQ